MLWDTPTTYVLIWVINVTDPTEADVVLKLFGGHDRHAHAETYLEEGTFEIWIVAGTIPNRNVTVGSVHPKFDSSGIGMRNSPT